MPVYVAQLAERLDATHLDLLEIFLDENLLHRELRAGFVVPDLDLDAAVLRAALGRRV